MCSCRRDSTTRRSVAGRTSFRSPPSAATAPTLAQADVLRYEGVTPAIADGLKQLGDAGIGDGSFAKILFNAPGFALAYAWHKSDFPLPLHSHDSDRSEEHTSELQSLMRISYAVFCLKKKTQHHIIIVSYIQL